MQILPEVIAVLTPVEMSNLKKQSGITLRELSQRTEICMSTLSEFMHAKNGISVEQAIRCERVLLAAAKERSQALSILLAREEMAAAS